MKRLMTFICVLFFSIEIYSQEKTISDIEQTEHWIYIYDSNGKKIKTMSVSSTGTIVGWSSTFFIGLHGNWYYFYDANGRKFNTLYTKNIGEIISVSGNTFTAKTSAWIITYDKNGKRINTRPAKR